MSIASEIAAEYANQIKAVWVQKLEDIYKEFDFITDPHNILHNDFNYSDCLDIVDKFETVIKEIKNFQFTE